MGHGFIQPALSRSFGFASIGAIGLEGAKLRFNLARPIKAEHIRRAESRRAGTFETAIKKRAIQISLCQGDAKQDDGIVPALKKAG